VEVEVVFAYTEEYADDVDTELDAPDPELELEPVGVAVDVALAPEFVADDPETAVPEALDVPETDPDVADPDAAEPVSPATGQTVVDVYTVSVTFPMGQSVTLAAQEVIVYVFVDKIVEVVYSPAAVEVLLAGAEVALTSEASTGQ
jgi:hypothetical protein